MLTAAFVVMSPDKLVALGVILFGVVMLGFVLLQKVWPKPQYSPFADVTFKLGKGYDLGDITDDHLQYILWYIGLTKQERDRLSEEAKRSR
jgi:hypothetical protein